MIIMMYLTDYPHHFQCEQEPTYKIEGSASATQPRWHYAVEGGKQLIATCVIAPTGISALLIIAVVAPVIKLIGTSIQFISNIKNSIETGRIDKKFIQCFDVSWFCLKASGSLLIFSVFKVVVIAGLFFGILCPEIGEKTKIFHDKIKQIFKKEVLSLFEKLVNLEKREECLNVLELPLNCSEEDIRKGYRQLALKYHPDKNPSPEADARFQKIKDAYEYLTGKSV